MKGNYVREFSKGSVIFEEGSFSNTMFVLQTGKVGIYKDYDEPNQIKLAEVIDGVFGEMGLVSDAPRSATAVALEDCEIEMVSRTDLPAYFEEYPLMKEIILDTISKRIRDVDREYMKVCGCIGEYIKADEAGEPKNPELIAKMKKFASNV